MTAGGLRIRGVSILVGLGLTAGIMGGILGIGGGALVVPGLVFLLNFNQHRAHGTSLAVVLCLSTASVITYWSHSQLDLLLSVDMAVGGVIGALLGARVARRIESRWLRLIFCGFLGFVGLMMMWGGMFGQGHLPGSDSAVIDFGALGGVAAAVAVGVVTGVLSGMLGIGGGMVMVPAMVLLLGVPQQTAQGVSLAVMFPTALTGMAMHHAMGNVDLRVAVWVGIGAVLGALAGANVAVRMDPDTLKVVFGVFLAVMTVLMALKKK